MSIKIYTYKKCSTCRNATKWLNKKGLLFEELPIRETPPEKKELETMLEAYDGELRPLFNTSGRDYRALALKDKIPTMSKQEAFKLLTENGNLVKRPFLLSDSFKAVGFKSSTWEASLD